MRKYKFAAFLALSWIVTAEYQEVFGSRALPASSASSSSSTSVAGIPFVQLAQIPSSAKITLVGKDIFADDNLVISGSDLLSAAFEDPRFQAEIEMRKKEIELRKKELRELEAQQEKVRSTLFQQQKISLKESLERQINDTVKNLEKHQLSRDSLLEMVKQIKKEKESVPSTFCALFLISKLLKNFTKIYLRSNMLNFLRLLKKMNDLALVQGLKYQLAKTSIH